MFWNPSNCCFSVSSPHFPHSFSSCITPLSIKDTEAGYSAQLRTRWQALGRGALHRSHTLHGEGCFKEVLVEDERADAWALPVSLPSIHLYAFFTLGPCFKFTFSEAQCFSPRTTEFPPPFHFSLIFICLLIYLALCSQEKTP